jgi:two-component system response regulator QseB
VRILLVEDDDMLGEAVRDGLRQEGYVVDWVQEGPAALAALSTTAFSALVLDLGLPRCDGLAVLRWLRHNGHHTPVVIVTARDHVSDRIAGLDAGADDYLIKPFDIDELSARLRAVTRRVEGGADTLLAVGEVALDLRQRLVSFRGEPAALTAREYAVVELLMRKAGRLVRRTEIEEELYGFDDHIASNAIEVHIHNLRRKLGAHFITNHKGRGYRVDVLRAADDPQPLPPDAADVAPTTNAQSPTRAISAAPRGSGSTDSCAPRETTPRPRSASLKKAPLKLPSDMPTSVSEGK